MSERVAERARAHRRDTSDAARIAALCRWFRRNARDLPWRRQRQRGARGGQRAAYSALVAEFMLQQTQVARVVERYEAFLKCFPSVKALAMTREQKVLTMWNGLGYYRRARNLHAAANMIVRSFAGRIPRTVDDLQRLPGVGRYTAGAIASMVFGQRVPVVDGNVRRVLARWFDRPARRSRLRDEIENWSWRIADRLVKVARKPGVFNEALMELGATICTPRAPRCAECPVKRWCAARCAEKNATAAFGRRRVKRLMVHHHAVIVMRKGHVLLEQRSDAGMWANMWQVPTVESSRVLSAEEVRRRLRVPLVRIESCQSAFDHHTTHRHCRFHMLRAQTTLRRGTWKRLSELDHLPMGNAQRRVLKALMTWAD